MQRVQIPDKVEHTNDTPSCSALRRSLERVVEPVEVSMMKVYEQSVSRVRTSSLGVSPSGYGRHHC